MRASSRPVSRPRCAGSSPPRRSDGAAVGLPHAAERVPAEAYRSERRHGPRTLRSRGAACRHRHRAPCAVVDDRVVRDALCGNVHGRRERRPTRRRESDLPILELAAAAGEHGARRRARLPEASPPGRRRRTAVPSAAPARRATAACAARRAAPHRGSSRGRRRRQLPTASAIPPTATPQENPRTAVSRPLELDLLRIILGLLVV